jgi:hypothetical protein
MSAYLALSSNIQVNEIRKRNILPCFGLGPMGIALRLKVYFEFGQRRPVQKTLVDRAHTDCQLIHALRISINNIFILADIGKYGFCRELYLLWIILSFS